MKLSHNSNILVLSHFYVRATAGGGPPQEVREYLLKKVNKIVYIEHPFPYADDKRSSMSVYENGKLKEQLFTPIRNGPEVFFYFADFWISAYFILKSKKIFDACIALDCLNTISMIPFRFLGIIKKLIFYTIDYVPQRFPNRILNRLYHLVDRLACLFADTIWVLSPKMTESRLMSGVRRMAPTVTLPMGANLERIRPLPISKINRHQFIFVGILLEKQGLQLIIQALPKIIKKVKDVQLVVVGKGEYEQTLIKLAHDLHVERYINFLGFVEKHSDVEKLLCKSAIGIAPYMPISDNYTYFTDPGKPKLYLGCALPVVITDVPAIARVIQAKKAGFVMDYSVQSCATILIRLLTNEKLYAQYRRNAMELAKSYDTNSLIKRALDKTG